MYNKRDILLLSLDILNCMLAVDIILYLFLTYIQSLYLYKYTYQRL